MSEHELIQDRLFAYVDGELEPRDAQAVEQHVAACTACASELATTRQASFVLAAAPAHELPSGFYDSLWARIDAAEDGEVEEDEDALAELGRGLDAAEEAERRVEDVGEAHAEDVGGRRVERPALTLLALETVTPHTNGKVAPRPRQGYRATLSRLAVAAVLLLSFALGLRLLWPKPAAPPTSDAVLAYGADVTIKSADTSTERTVQRAVALQAGNFIATSKDSAIVTIGKTGSLRLAPMSRVLVQAVSTREGRVFVKIRLDQGAAWVKEGEDVQCVVQTSNAILVPLGTSYDAHVDDGDTRVSVFQGQVRVSPTGLDETGEALEAGQQARISEGGRRVTTSLVNASEVQNDPWYQWNQQVEAPPASQHQPMEAPRVVNTPPAPMPWFQNPPPAPRWTVSPQDARWNRGAPPQRSTPPAGGPSDDRRGSTPGDPWDRTGGSRPSTGPWNRTDPGTPTSSDPWRRTPTAPTPGQPSWRPSATPRTTTWNPAGAPGATPGRTSRWPQQGPGQAPGQTPRWPQHGPGQTPGQTPRGPQQGPGQMPGQTPRWPQQTPGQMPGQAPGQTPRWPQQGPEQTTRWPQRTPGQPQQTPGQTPGQTPRWPQQGPGQTTRWPQQTPGQPQQAPGQTTRWPRQAPGDWPRQGPGQRLPRPDVTPGGAPGTPNAWPRRRNWPGTAGGGTGWPGSGQPGTMRPGVVNQQGRWGPGQRPGPRTTRPTR